MKCKQVKYKLSEYLDGRLGEKEKIQIEKHIDSCHSCREYFEDLINYQKLVSSLDPKKAPEDLEEKVLKRLQRPVLKTAGRDIVIPLWAKTIAAAILIGFIYLILPDQYFGPAVIETEYMPLAEKRSKGGGNDKKGPKMHDVRIRFIDELATKNDGEILDIDYDQSNKMTNAVSVRIPKRSWPEFVDDYNRSNPLNILSDTIPFTLSRKIRLKIYLGANSYVVKDFNNDGFDDVLMFGLTGRKKDHAVVAFNNKKYGFNNPDNFELADGADLISKSRNTFKSDINGDGIDEFIERINTGEQPTWIFYTDSTKADKMAIHFEPHTSGYFGEYMIFFGDFNGDGFDDILAKNGSSIKEGEWYISLNNQKNGFKLGYDVYWGENRFLVFNKVPDLLE